MSESNKYKEFRNYMVNEIGITRQDIEAWTKQSVANEIQKVLGGVDIEKTVQDKIHTLVNNAIRGTSIGYGNGASEMRKAIASEIAQELMAKITIK